METLINIFLDIKFFGIKLINVEDFTELAVRFGLNLLVSIIIIRYIYYPVARRKDYLFTYLLMSVVVYFLCDLLSNVKLELGFALGLFAIMGIIRYRTDAIAIKEMTYLFVIIGVSVINALANKKVSYTELLFTNTVIIGTVFVLEKLWWSTQESSKVVTYEKIEMIKPENHAELIQDLKNRTGLEIHRISIGKIDFLRDTASIRIYYHEAENNESTP